MINCWRHFRALSKKNAIVWYRTPTCACIEILTPAALMALLCILRVYIPTTDTDAKGMLSHNLPVYPGTVYYEGAWQPDSHEDDFYDVPNRALVAWSNYKGDTHHDTPWEYTMSYDKYGP